MSRSAVTAVLALVAVLVFGVLVFVALGGLGSDDGAGPPDPSVCDVLRPDGVAPSGWFDDSGRLVLTSDQVGKAALAFGMRAGFGSDDPDARLVADLLRTYVPDAERGRSPTPAEREALTRLDRSVDGCPSS